MQPGLITKPSIGNEFLVQAALVHTLCAYYPRTCAGEPKKRFPAREKRVGMYRSALLSVPGTELSDEQDETGFRFGKDEQERMVDDQGTEGGLRGVRVGRGHASEGGGSSFNPFFVYPELCLLEQDGDGSAIPEVKQVAPAAVGRENALQSHLPERLNQLYFIGFRAEFGQENFNAMQAIEEKSYCLMVTPLIRLVLRLANLTL